MELVKPQLFTEAIHKLGQRTPIGSQLTSAQWQQVPVALRERAFFSSQVENVNFLRDMRGFLEDFLSGARETITLPNGKTVTTLKVGSRADFVKLAREAALRYGVGPVDPEDKGTIKDIQSEQRLNLIFDINVEGAQQYGSWLQGMDPEVLNEYPAWEFIRVQDVKTPRVPHQLNEGRIVLKTDLEFWLAMNSPSFGGFGVPWGPWGFNSGMGTEDIDRDRAEEAGVIKPGHVLEPIHKDFNDHLEASVRNLPQDLRDMLKTSFGDQIEITDNSARWVGQPTVTPPPKPEPEPAPKPQVHVRPTPPPEPIKPAPVTPQATLDRITATLDDLAAKQNKGVGPIERDRLRKAAHEAISIPESDRGKLPLKFRTKTARRIAAREGAEWVEKFVSKELVETTDITVQATTSDRASYDPVGRAIKLTEFGTPSVAAHEIMHGVEMQHRSILLASARYLFNRAAGELTKTLRSLTGNPGYKLIEIAFSDRWKETGGNAYSGKVYSRIGAQAGQPVPAPENIQATELLTMGIDRMIADPVGFWMQDPDFMLFLLRTFRGIIDPITP